MRSLTASGLEFIKRFEGFRARRYTCEGGFETIGFGHRIISKQERESFKNGITEEQALALLQKDVRTAETAVLSLITAPLTDNQFSAVVSFTYNVGSGALQRSSMRQQINREEHENVPQELMKWVYAGGKKLKGLVLRRSAEGLLYGS